MSNIKPDDLRRQAAEDEFFRLAALEIESEQNEEFLEAQSLPDPSPEVLQRMQANLQQTMRKTQKRERRRTIFLNLKRFSACAAIVCCLLISGTYFSVDAARNSINNFVLELFDDYAIVRTEVSQPQSGPVLPTNWEGPFYLTWVPEKFESVQGTALNYSWALKYDSANGKESMSICIWDAVDAPRIDIKDNTLLEETEIQGGTASIYSKNDKKVCTLLWTKSNYIIMISGDISATEAKKVAENFVF